MSKPAIAIIPQTDQVVVGDNNQEQTYLYSDPALAALLLEPSLIKVFADAVEGQARLGQQGLEVSGQVFDVKLADSLLTAGLNIDNSIPSITERYQGKLRWEPTTQDLLTLRDSLREKLIEEDLVKVAVVEFDATKATAQMSQNGVRLDTAWLRDKQVELRKEQKVLDAQIKKWLSTYNPHDKETISTADLTSTKKADKTQTLEWFNNSGIPLSSFKKDNIQSLATEHPVLNDFLQLRSIDSLIGNKGIQGLLNAVDQDNKVYPTWHQNAAATGRMSATEPAIQNIPGDLKRAIIPEQKDGEERRVFVRADYSQQELRILAQISGDRNLTQAYQEGRDAHKLTASLMTGKPEEEVTKEERERGKPVNFGKIYGQSPQGLQGYAKASYGVDFSLSEAQKFQAAMDKGYPGVAKNEQKVRQDFKQQWYNKLNSENAPLPQTRTLLLRKREWIPERNKYPPVTEALNAPIQGSGADMSKSALADLYKKLKNTGATITIVRHDEIVLTSPESQLEKVGQILERTMLDAAQKITPDIPAVAEVSICDNLALEQLSQQDFEKRESRLSSSTPHKLRETVLPLSLPSNDTLKSKPTIRNELPTLETKVTPRNNTARDFDIRDHIKFRNGRGECPCCAAEGKVQNSNFSVRENGDFWCFRGSRGEPPGKDIEQFHDEKAIRKALGYPEVGKIEPNLAIREFNQSQQIRPSSPKVKIATEEDLAIAQNRLLSPKFSDRSFQKKTLNYLENRGISPDMAKHYNIGLNLGFKTPDGTDYPASITFYHRDAAEPEKLYARRRYAPWIQPDVLPPGTPKWGQSGVPPSFWVVHAPVGQSVLKTYLTEGPWDAVVLGEAVRQSGKPIAVACTSTGAKGVLPTKQLQALPGEDVIIFYDRFDSNNEGQIGAEKMANAIRNIGKQATVALVPHREGNIIEGWDISDALKSGFTLKDIEKAEVEAKQMPEKLASLLADYYDLTRYKGVGKNIDNYTPQWDSIEKLLKLVNTNSNEVFTAQLSSGSWQNINSALSTEQMINLKNLLEVNLDSQELQTRRFKEVYPVVADILRHYKSNYFEGKYYSAQWEPASRRLTAWKHGDIEPFLSGQWEKHLGWQDISTRPISFSIAHHEERKY